MHFLPKISLQPNLLDPKERLICINNSVLTSKETQSISLQGSIGSRDLRNKHCSAWKHKKLINKFCKQNAQLVKVKASGIYS
jgi:hypothetical protein